MRLLLEVSRHLLDRTIAIHGCRTDGDRLRMLRLVCGRRLLHCARRFGYQRVGGAAHILLLGELLLAGHGAGLLSLGLLQIGCLLGCLGLALIRQSVQFVCHGLRAL